MSDAKRFARVSSVQWTGSLSLLAVLLTLGACARSGTNDQSRADLSAAPTTGSTTVPAEVRRHPVITRAEPRQRARFELLRTPPEGLPARVRHILGAPVMGMNWTLAQRLPVNLSGAYWLVPGNGHLCIVDQGSLGNPAVGTTCARTARALARGIASITIARPNASAHTVQSRLIVGVAPDGAREVQVHTRGTVVTTSVAGTIFVVRDTLAAPPDRLSWR